MKNGSDNRIKGPKKENVNVIGLLKVMNVYLRGSEKSQTFIIIVP